MIVRKRESICVCELVCVRDKVYACVRDGVCVSVCVCEFVRKGYTERERGRERAR